MLDRLITLSVDVRNFALVTHAVPAKRVEPHLPDAYTLETFAVDGVEQCLISATCFCDQNFRWSALPYPRHTFNETTYRTYVTHRGRRGVYFFRRYLGTSLARVTQRAFEMHACRGDFDISIEAGKKGYNRYRCEVRSDDDPTMFLVTAADLPAARHPFSTGEDLAQFITYRLHGFFTSSTGAQGHMPVRHPRLRPWAGRLSEGHFGVWRELGMLTDEEARDPYSVLVQPQVPFTLYPPRPLGA